MTLKECYEILGLNGDADLAEVKKSYRRLAFSLHPDLNPDVPDASRHFQQLNEAYVILTQTLASEEAKGKGRPGKADSAKAREEAKKAYKKAQEQAEQTAEFAQETRQEQEQDVDKEDLLKDILNDPFARRVFEDIYSHIRQENRTRSSGKTNAATESSFQNKGANTAGERASAAGKEAFSKGKPVSPKRKSSARQKNAQHENNGLMGGIKGWLRKQIDDEQELRLPGEQLVPGARVRLEIQHGLAGEQETIELTLPPGFTPGKTMRLKGMGKRVGNWRGDLYVRSVPA